MTEEAQNARLTEHERRLGSLDTRMDRIEGEKFDSRLNVLVTTVANIERELSEIRSEVIWMKRALVSAIFTLLGGMILFLVSIAGGWLA